MSDHSRKRRLVRRNLNYTLMLHKVDPKGSGNWEKFG